RAGDEAFVGKLLFQLLDLRAQPRDLLVEAGALLADVDGARPRQHPRRLLDHPLFSARGGCAAGGGGGPLAAPAPAPAPPGRPRASVVAPASRSMAGILAAAGTFISARTARTSEIRRIAQSSSALAAASRRLAG